MLGTYLKNNIDKRVTTAKVILSHTRVSLMSVNWI